MRHLIVKRMHFTRRFSGARFENQRALTEVVDDQQRHHEREPRDANRLASKVTHVGVKRLGTRDREHCRAQHDEE